MQLIDILYNNSISLTLTSEEGQLGFSYPVLTEEVTKEKVEEAIEVVQEYIEQIVTAKVPFILPNPEVFFASNVEVPFMVTEMTTVSFLFDGMAISVNGNQYYMPKHVLENPTDYFEKIPNMTAYVLKDTDMVLPDIVVLWKVLGEKHPLNFIDAPVEVDSHSLEYEALNTVELDQYEVHVSKVSLQEDGEGELLDVLIAVDKIYPDKSFVMCVKLDNIWAYGDHESLGRTASWCKYLSSPALSEQDIFGRALRELDFLRF